MGSCGCLASANVLEDRGDDIGIFDAGDDAQQLRELGASRPWCPMKRRAASFEIARPVEKEHMEVNVERQPR